ncbi:hypothetical protein Acsp01_13450 [Actinoplanes sp. NBRC 101535]|nr:hypothetical protein Acsp01_13450 [Actinoplanes sp. NBRC 101535]
MEWNYRSEMEIVPAKAGNQLRDQHCEVLYGDSASQWSPVRIEDGSNRPFDERGLSSDEMTVLGKSMVAYS